VIINKINGKLYVGATQNTLKDRYEGHMRQFSIGSDRLIYKAMRKYGVENFTIETTQEYQSKKDMFQGEIDWIKYLDTFRSDYGYNDTTGGEGGDTNGGKTFSNEWRKNISIANAGKPQIHRRRFSDEQEKEICELYSKLNKTTYYLANKYDCYRNTIHDVLMRGNIEIRQSNYNNHKSFKKKITDEQEKEVCKLYVDDKISRSAIAVKTGIAKTTVRDILLRNNVKL
jgi:group I intron endonuclease